MLFQGQHLSNFVKVMAFAIFFSFIFYLSNFWFCLNRIMKLFSLFTACIICFLRFFLGFEWFKHFELEIFQVAVPHLLAVGWIRCVSVNIFLLLLYLLTWLFLLYLIDICLRNLLLLLTLSLLFLLVVCRYLFILFRVLEDLRLLSIWIV